MPLIDRINGIKIYIYNGEHRPPHIHAVYNEYKVLIEFEEIYAGYLPNKHLKQTFDWRAGNKNWVLDIFYELNPILK